MAFVFEGDAANSFGPLTRLFDRNHNYTWTFTLLFQDAILLSGPLILGSLLLIIEGVFKACSRPQQTIAGLFSGILSWVKVVLYTVLLALSFHLAIQTLLWNANGMIPASTWTNAGAVMTLVAPILIAIDNLFHHVYYLKASSPAQLLLGWWIISDVVSVRTRWLLAAESRTLSIVGIVSLIAKLTIILAEEWSKRSVLTPVMKAVPPESLAGIYNRIFIAWINPLMCKSLFGITSADELWLLGEEFRAPRLIDDISKQEDSIAASPATPRRHLLLLLMQQYWWSWLAPVPNRLAQAAFQFAQPFLIYQTLFWLYTPSQDSQVIGYGLLGAFACAYIGVALTTSFGQYQMVRLCAKVRADLIARIYMQSLKVKVCEIQGLAALTLMSTNVDKVIEGLTVLQEFVVSLPTIAVGLWLLERQIGLGAVGPVAIVAVAAIVIAFCLPRIAKAQSAWLDAVKIRVQFASQVLAGFQTAKMSGLIGPLAAKLQSLREIELSISLASRKYMVMTVSTSLSIPNLAPLLALAVYAVVLRRDGSTLNEIVAFTALSYITLITFPLLVLLQTAPPIIQGWASLDQIDGFLRTGVPNKTVQSTVGAPLQEKAMQVDTSSAIILNQCSFTRSLKANAAHFDFSASFPVHSHTLILGPSASGKTTLLEAILGEMYCVSGTVSRSSVIKDIAFVAQRPWIRSGSIQDNIVLDSAYDESWYRQVLHACALDKDALRITSYEAGASGFALSGGQRQKVSLARAVYSRKSLLVIDEPFAGVDATSCEQISERLFGLRGLARERQITLIIATHSGKLLPQADHVLVLGSDRRIVQQGPPSQLDLSDYQRQQDTTDYKAADEIVSVEANPTAYVLASQPSVEKEDAQDHRQGELAAYYYYFKALGRVRMIIVIAFVATFVFFQLFTQPWITWWTKSNLLSPNNNMGYWLGLYAMYAALAILALAGACWVMLVQMIRTSGNSLHATLCKTIERAPITLFSSLSPGLTINRFSQDMSLVDMDLPLALSNTVITGMLTLGQFGLVLSASKYLAAALPVVVFACVVIQRLYIKTSRQLRFHEIEAKAPLYTQFIETLDGLASVRAYKLQDTLLTEMTAYIDACQRPWYLLYCAQRYLGVALNLTVAGLVIVMLGIAIAARGKTDTSFYGLALVNTMTFGMWIAMTIDYWCLFEIGLAAVERTKHFAEHTPQEHTEEIDDDCEQPFSDGAIKIAQLSAGYGNGNVVLHDVSLAIRPGEKVAICGRSGSGKSTLLFALLRSLEAKHGIITIDGRDISRIPHESLRKLISSVPQEPLILDDTVRWNMDMLGEKTDEEIQTALTKAGLGEMTAIGLDTCISAKSLSFAEKQLICLARALLKHSKLLVLDEASSSVDVKTDEQIQKIVCQDLLGVSVVSVMHRFDQIKLYDRVVMMADGRVVEDGRPDELLSRSTTAFAKLYASQQGQ